MEATPTVQLLVVTNPSYKLISLYPNNTRLLAQHAVPDEFAKRMGKDKIDPLSDYRYWLYTIAHEYNHHSSFFYGTSGNVKSNTYGGKKVFDVNLSPIGKEFLDIMGLTKHESFSDHNKVQPIPPFSGGSITVPWPSRWYGTSHNQYLWTKAELLARGLALYTYPVPKELQNENSVNAYGGIIDDYWWMHNYKSNIYEEHKTNDEARKPIQEPVDKHLEKLSKFLDDEWFNDDAKFGEIINDYTGKLYLTSRYKAKHITLVNENNKEDVVTFEKLDKIVNLQYFWRPFDSRKAKKIQVESNVYKANKFIEDHDNRYELRYKNKAVAQAFGLAQDDKIT